MSELKKQKTKYLGQTLIETMVALFILSMGVSSAVGLSIYAFGSSNSILKQIIGTGLAREGIEAVRNMRDTNWLNDSLITNGCYNFATGVLDSENCYQNWLGDKSSTGVPFCINPYSTASGGAVSSAQIIFGADDSHQTYINGSFLGSASSWNVASVYNSVPLQIGKNVLASKVTNNDGHGGLLVDITLGASNIGSNSGWKYYKSLDGTPPPNQGSFVWTDVNYNDSAWLNAVDLGSYSTTYPWTPAHLGPIVNIPINTPAHWLWDTPNGLGTYTLFVRGTISNSNGGCETGVVNTPISYGLSSDSSLSNYWTLFRTDTNFGLKFNDINSTEWQRYGFFSQSGGGVACDNSSGNSEFCRRVVLTKIDNITPYSTAISAGDTTLYLLKVQSQVWWTDKKCKRVNVQSDADFQAIPASCKVQLDTYLTNWKY
jgi:type II secretory pathway pseudopilin PulG